MKYCVLIIDGAAGRPVPGQNKTCLELAGTLNLDAMVQEGTVGLARTVPPGMEPSSAVACMSVLGYDPAVYYKGRAAIEARAMDIPVNPGDVVFRCNLVSIEDDKMADYSAGHISTSEAQSLIQSLTEKLGNENIIFYPGVNYRHICKITGHQDAEHMKATPPHDIPRKPIGDFWPTGPGSDFVGHIMTGSASVLRNDPVNQARAARGQRTADMVWLFWGSGQVPDMPSFKKQYGVHGALTSAVDLLRGLAKMTGLHILDIPGVTDGPDNDYAAQASGALRALDERDLVVIHIEAPDEAAHSGSVRDKIAAIERTDREVVGRLRARKDVRVLIMPDHPTPIKVQTHVDDPVPFLLWGPGFGANGARRFTEAEAKGTGIFIDEGYKIMGRLISGDPSLKSLPNEGRRRG